MPVMHIFYCTRLKTEMETCVTGMSQTLLRHKWKPGLEKVADGSEAVGS